MDELKAALAELQGIKPKEIAAMIGRRKIKGRPGTTGRCPLAVMMHGAHGGQFIVGQKYVIHRSGEAVSKLRTPDNLAAFIRMFDAGKFPDLIQVPPRCQKSTGTAGKPRSGPGGTSHKRAKVKLHLARMAERFKTQ